MTKLVLAEYAAQYKDRPSSGHLETIKDWDDDTWRTFLGLISWLFSDADEAVAWDRLVAAVKNCRFYNEQHEGKEEVIASSMVDLFDRKQTAKEYGERFVHAADVELIFRKVASGELRAVDPTWRSWDGVDPPTDQRNVGEKFVAACPTLSTSALSRYQRRTADGLVELEAHQQDKNVVAMRYQIYDECEAALASLAAKAGSLTEAQLDAEIASLTARALARVEKRATEYGYKHKTDEFVRGLVLELFDSCFLAFDKSGTG